MPRPWKRPPIPPGPLGELNRALHELHHQAGWPSSREIQQALDDKGVSMSHTKVHDTLAKPVLPTKGAVEMITEVLANKVRGADVNAEIHRLLRLWQEASIDVSPSSPPAVGSPFVETKEEHTQHHRDTWQQHWEKANAGDVDAMNNLGALLAQAGRVKEAVQWYGKAAEQDHPFAMYNLGNLLKEAGLLEEAEGWFRKAAKQDDVDAMNNLGALLAQAGRMVEARPWFWKAAGLDHPYAMYNLGILLEEAGLREEAEGLWQRAREIEGAE